MHCLQFVEIDLYSKFSNSFSDIILDLPLDFSLAISAIPSAPISPAMSGLVTSTSVKFSKALKTASDKKVPPCTTIWFPSSLGSLTFITFWIAFLITEYASPADISGTDAPSFCACFTFEFIKTVQREPKSTGALDFVASFANSFALILTERAKVSRKDPHPAEQASFNKIDSITPSLIFMDFISCPPISKIKSTSGSKYLAAVKWAMVSTSPKSKLRAAFKNSSPYPVVPQPAK